MADGDEIITRTVIAAQPNYAVGVFYEDGTLFYQDVLAWEVERVEGTDMGEGFADHRVIPLTLAGNPASYGDWVLRTPDDGFEFPNDGPVFDTEAKAVQYFMQRAKAREASAAKMRARDGAS